MKRGPARSYYRDVWTARQEVRHDRGPRQLLEVVEDEQEMPVLERLHERVQDGLWRLSPDVERGQDRGGGHPRVREGAGGRAGGNPGGTRGGAERPPQPPPRLSAAPPAPGPGQPAFP